MKRVGRIAAPFVAVGLALTSGCEAAPTAPTQPSLAPISQQTGEALYAALKARADRLAALAISTLRGSTDIHDSGAFDTESGAEYCADNLPDYPVENDSALRARACVGGDNGLVEINLSNYGDGKNGSKDGRYNVSFIFHANEGSDPAEAAKKGNLAAVEAAIGDVNTLVGGAGFENGRNETDGSLATDLTWVFAVDDAGKIMGSAQTDTVNADPLINGDPITPDVVSTIGGSLDKITDLMTR